MHHTYREVSPYVFTNNRLSAALDTGKPFDEVKDRYGLSSFLQNCNSISIHSLLQGTASVYWFERLWGVHGSYVCTFAVMLQLCLITADCRTDEVLRGAALLPSIILNPDMTAAEDAAKSALVKAAGFDGDFFKWMEQGDDKKRLNRFGVAMTNLETIFPRELIIGRTR